MDSSTADAAQRKGECPVECPGGLYGPGAVPLSGRSQRFQWSLHCITAIGAR